MKKIVLSLFLGLGTLAMAQTSGTVSYNMEFSSDNPEMAMAVGMMQGSKMVFSFIPGKTKMESTIGTMMKMSSVSDTKAGKSLMLMEVMGQKTATPSQIKEEAEDKANPGPTVEKTTETKEIIGYKCVKNIVKSADGTEMIVWTTGDITASLAGQKQFGGVKIDGFPLEFTTVSNGMNIHFTATGYDKAVNKKGFSTKIPEGYTEMSAEQLQNMGGAAE
jgi:hypothetical protein